MLRESDRRKELLDTYNKGDLSDFQVMDMMNNAICFLNMIIPLIEKATTPMNNSDYASLLIMCDGDGKLEREITRLYNESQN